MDAVLNKDNLYSENLVSQNTVFLSELQALLTNTEALLLDLHLSSSNDIVSIENTINVTIFILKSPSYHLVTFLDLLYILLSL